MKKPVISMLVFAGIILFGILILQPLEVYHFRDYIATLFPKGVVALEERNLFYIIQVIMLFVVIPVYILTFIFSWWYRYGNSQSTYDPDIVDNVIAEYFWWGTPLVFTLAIAILTAIKTFELDPYKPLESPNKPLKIQAVALQWKWLFLYPEEKIATLNFLQIPTQRPIHFEITADAPMNSLWIPSLGGQIYAMPSMRTELHLIADKPGDYRGSSANISGEGFAGMHFITRATSEEEYKKWVDEAKNSKKNLAFKEYEMLAVPTLNNPVETYKLSEPDLFNRIIMKYMHPK